MKLGIIGLPNAGKTTIFNALTGQDIETAAWPGTIGEEAHVGMISVPDERIDRLSAIFNPKKTVYADVMCSDITGFAKGVSTSKQRAQVINQAWEADLLLHVVRTFEDPGIVHPDGGIDPARDAAALELELVFHDLELAETRLERIALAARKGIGKELEGEQAVLQKCRAHLEEEQPLRTLDLSDEEKGHIGSLMLLSAKPELVVLNVAEEEIGSPATVAAVQSLESFYQGKGALVFALCGRIEAELSQLPPDEAALFLADLGIERPALDVVIRSAYELLGLISFFTVGEDEVRAWTIRADTTALKAASKIHSDIERGFIKAETVGYEDFIGSGSLAAAKEKALLRLEGKEYVVRDGDIINFRFNV